MNRPGDVPDRDENASRRFRTWLKGHGALPIVAVSAILCCSAYGQGGAPAHRGPLHFPNVSTEKADVVAGTLTARGILRLLFGNYDPASQSSKWPATAHCQDFFDDRQPECTTAVLKVHHYQVGGPERALVLLATPPPSPGDDCHGCAPTIGYAIFALEGDSWRLVSDDPSIGRFGEYGKAGKYDIVHIGPGSIGLLFFAEGTGQGYFTQSMEVFAEVHGALVAVLSLREIAGNDAGACPGLEPCWAYRSTYTHRPSPSSPLYDLLLTTKGTMFVAGAIVRVDKKAAWVFNGTNYVPKK